MNSYDKYSTWSLLVEVGWWPAAMSYRKVVEGMVLEIRHKVVTADVAKCGSWSWWDVCTYVLCISPAVRWGRVVGLPSVPHSRKAHKQMPTLRELPIGPSSTHHAGTNSCFANRLNRPYVLTNQKPQRPPDLLQNSIIWESMISQVEGLQPLDVSHRRGPKEIENREENSEGPC